MFIPIVYSHLWCTVSHFQCKGLSWWEKKEKNQLTKFTDQSGIGLNTVVTLNNYSKHKGNNSQWSFNALLLSCDSIQDHHITFIVRRKVEKRFSITSFIFRHFHHIHINFMTSTSIRQHYRRSISLFMVIPIVSNYPQCPTSHFRCKGRSWWKKEKSQLTKFSPQKKFTLKHRPYSLKTLVPHRK